RSNQANMVIVAITLLALIAFLIAGLPLAIAAETEPWQPFFLAPEPTGNAPLAGFLEACALMFVAYTGYGRIATLGEEIREPKRSIPIAIIITLGISMLLYGSVGFVAIGASGAETLAAATQQRAAPLEVIAGGFQLPAIGPIVAIGAITAMLGVLLNLILGLSRVAYAMGRRGDLPTALARVSRSAATPSTAVLLVGGIIAALTLIGNVKTTWSFSAFSVLIYYAITNLAAIRLTPDERRFPRFIPWSGLVACLFLAFWVEPQIWMIGLGLIAIGLVWQQASLRWGRGQASR
ncbi:MAG: APC family permease, partial [Novipirellula sp. JB048]